VLLVNVTCFAVPIWGFKSRGKTRNHSITTTENSSYQTNTDQDCNGK